MAWLLPILLAPFIGSFVGTLERNGITYFVVDAALELKILNVPGFAHLLFRIERWAFESAGTLVTISGKMIEARPRSCAGNVTA